MPICNPRLAKYDMWHQSSFWKLVTYKRFHTFSTWKMILLHLFFLTNDSLAHVLHDELFLYTYSPWQIIPWQLFSLTNDFLTHALPDKWFPDTFSPWQMLLLIAELQLSRKYHSLILSAGGRHQFSWEERTRIWRIGQHWSTRHCFSKAETYEEDNMAGIRWNSRMN